MASSSGDAGTPPPPDLIIEYAKRGNVTGIKETPGKDPRVRDAVGHSALHWAAAGGHAEAIDVLVSLGWDVNAKDKVGDTPLHKAAWKGHLDAVKTLIKHKANLDIANNDSKIPLNLIHAKDDVKRQLQILLAPPIELEEDEDSD